MQSLGSLGGKKSRGDQWWWYGGVWGLMVVVVVSRVEGERRCFSVVTQKEIGKTKKKRRCKFWWSSSELSSLGTFFFSSLTLFFFLIWFSPTFLSCVFKVVALPSLELWFFFFLQTSHPSQKCVFVMTGFFMFFFFPWNSWLQQRWSGRAGEGRQDPRSGRRCLKLFLSLKSGRRLQRRTLLAAQTVNTRELEFLFVCYFVLFFFLKRS